MTDLMSTLAERQKLPPYWQRRAARENAGVSLRLVAENVGVSIASVQRWETESDPSDEHLARYLECLDVLRRFAK